MFSAKFCAKWTFSLKNRSTNKKVTPKKKLGLVGCDRDQGLLRPKFPNGFSPVPAVGFSRPRAQFTQFFKHFSFLPSKFRNCFVAWIYRGVNLGSKFRGVELRNKGILKQRWAEGVEKR